MGISRSVTLVVAYLLWVSRQPQTVWQPKSPSISQGSSPSPSPASTPEMISLAPTPLTVDSALALVREGRPQAEPNSGFIKQLRMYEAMDCPTTQEQLESHKIYRRWMYSRRVMDALSANRAPGTSDISFRDEEDLGDGDQGPEQNAVKGIENLAPQEPDGEITNPDISSSSTVFVSPSPQSSPDIELKCRKCRRLIAKSSFIIPHKPPPHRDPAADGTTDPCAHIFLHPLSWMKDVLSQGQLDGRLTCPNAKCGANIGKFAWQGFRCSCGGWVTPGFGITRGRVDEVRGRGKLVDWGGNDGKAAVGAVAATVRMPQGMRCGNGNL